MSEIEAQAELLSLRKRIQALQEEMEHCRQLLETEEQERRLLGYDIHDGLAQLLAGAMLQLSDFERLLPEDEARAWQSFDSGVRCVAQSLREARRLIHGLEPAELEEHGVIAAIEDLVSEANEHAGQQIEFVHDVDFVRIPPPIEHTIFRIVQEGLANACRYSKSDRICITLSQLDRLLQMQIEDWGIGFDPAHIPEGHFGLQSIQDRAMLFGGQATIQSKSGWGTTVSVSLPLVEASPVPA